MLPITSKVGNKSHVQTTSPIYTLPSEILALIFEDAHFSMIFELAHPKRNHMCPLEVIVSHVNRRWRTVAIATSSLWS